MKFDPNSMALPGPVARAKELLSSHIQVLVEEGGRKSVRWHFSASPSCPWIDVTGLPLGQEVFKVFSEVEPERSDLWEAAKTVFPKRYAELLRIHHPELLRGVVTVEEVELAGSGPLATGTVIRFG